MPSPPNPEPPPAPNPPEIQLEAEEEGAQLDGITMLIIGLSVGLLMGFLLGRYSKKISKSAAAASSMAGAISKAAAAAGNGDSQAIRDAEDELREDEDKEELMNKFMDNTQNPGIDDNPECEFNPVWEYKIKQQKAIDRIEFMRKRAEEEGLDFDEFGDNEGVGPPAGRKNALAQLIEAGARVTSVMSGDSATAQAARDARRKMKNIEAFLSKQMDIDVNMVKVEKGKRMEQNRMLTAYEKALETKKTRVEEGTTEVSLSAAKSARMQLREALRRNPGLTKPVDEDDDDPDSRQSRGSIMKRKDGVTNADLSALQLLAEELEQDVEEGDDDIKDDEPDDDEVDDQEDILRA